MSEYRRYSLVDQMCLGVDQALRAVAGTAKTTGRPYPAKKIPETTLNDAQRRQAAALMRINHTGEVCAQALYHGQGLVSKRPDVKEKMQQAAVEEGDHLAWCHQRLQELQSHTSYLNPFWYAGSLTMGLVAGWVGDRWSLGFLAETEQQVVQHLATHLLLLPKQDEKSAAILAKMQQDEAEHRDDAMAAGAAVLPDWIKKAMKMAAKVMVKTAYWI